MPETCVPSANQPGDVSLVHIEVCGAPAYKASRFNAHTTTPDGTVLIYNSLTGRNCAIPPKGAPTVERYLSHAGFHGSLDPLGEYLLREGYILLAEVDEDALWDARYGIQQYRSDVLELILLSSEDCNFRCIYCSQQFKRGSMLRGVRKGITRLIESRIPKLSSLSVHWFGGEPLLGYDAIEELAPAIQAIARQQRVPYASQMTTNAFLLTPDRFRDLVKWGVVSYQITIDGTGEEHDSHRPLVDGGETYDQIMRNVVAMRESSEDFRVALRINFDNTNMMKLRPLFEEFKERLYLDARFEVYFFPVGKWGGPNDATLDICQDSATAATFLSKQAREYGLKTGSLTTALTPGGGNVCYAARPYSYIIGADGKIMKCTVVLDTDKMNIVGQLSEQGEMKLDDGRFAAWVRPYYHSDSMCQKCFFVPVCQGASCPLPRITGGSRPCPSTKLTIRRTLNDIWEEKQQTGRLIQIGNSSKSGRVPTVLAPTSDLAIADR
jgi:uncharacterized protein